MITNRQRLRAATMIQMSRHRGRVQRPESACARTATRDGIFEVERAPRRCHPGQAAGEGFRPAPAGRPGIPDNEHK
jgi:hypothetical protein